MTRVAIRRQVAAPREGVFATASDFANAARAVQAIEKTEILTGGPVGVGTRFRETRRMFGRPATEEMTVAAFDPPRGYTLAAQSCGTRYETVFTFTEKDGGTEIEMCFGAEPLTLTAKVMAVVMRPMMKKMIAMCAKDLADIAAAAEAHTS